MMSEILYQHSGLWIVLALFSFLAIRAMVVAGGAFAWSSVSQWARAHAIVQSEIPRPTLIREILTGFKILLVDALTFTTLFKLGLFKFAPLHGWIDFSITFSAMFIWTEIYFYYSHRLLHAPKFFWIHRHHHQATRINAWTSLSFSVTERLILLVGLALGPALFSSLLPFPVEGYGLYFTANYLLNVYGHLNVEITPKKFLTSAVGQVLNTTTYHSLHHLRYRGHFGLFTSTLDKVHGSYFHDYQDMHARHLELT
jgi:lathosterol oxidase